MHTFHFDFVWKGSGNLLTELCEDCVIKFEDLSMMAAVQS